MSAAVSPSKTIMDVGYNVAEIATYLDWINVMTYGNLKIKLKS